MKKTITAITIFLFFLILAPYAEGITLPDALTDSLDDDMKSIFEDAGLFQNESITEPGQDRIFIMIGEIIKGQAFSPVKSAVISLAVMIAVSVMGNFLPEKSSLSEMGESLGLTVIMYSLISDASEIFISCCACLLTVKNFMLALIPVLGGIISAAGNPSLAISMNSLVFMFGESIVMMFSRVVPLLAGAGTVCAASTAINPMMRFSGLGRVIPRFARILIAFTSGIFVSVMSLRGIISGCADNVTIKGLRFLIGNAVPIVGSAIGEALGTVQESFSLMKNTVGLFGIAGIILAVLPAVIKTVLWKFCLFFLSISADMLDKGRIKGFCENMSEVFSLILAAILFSSFVFIISIAILITVSRGA